jgi:hypothetical protein
MEPGVPNFKHFPGRESNFSIRECFYC